ncbi:MAG: transposase, partial [Thermoplasmatota archaeon]
GYTYAWNDAGTDAELLAADRTATIDGHDWYFPSRSQCLQCHTAVADRVLGLRVQQLDGSFTYPDGSTDNQLAVLQRLLGRPIFQAELHHAGFHDVPGGIERTVVGDAGYWSEANATASGPDRLIATSKDWKQRRAAREMGTTTGPAPAGASTLEAMEHRLRTEEGAAAYGQRSCTVEAVFGQAKENRGVRRFMR